MQRREGFVGLNRDHVGARRHDLAHDFIAERDNGLDEPAVVLVNQTFFGAGGDEGFDVFGRGGGLVIDGVLLDNVEQRVEEGQRGHQRPGHQSRDSEEAEKAVEPVARGAAKQQLGNHVGG